MCSTPSEWWSKVSFVCELPLAIAPIPCLTIPCSSVWSRPAFVGGCTTPTCSFKVLSAQPSRVKAQAHLKHRSITQRAAYWGSGGEACWAGVRVPGLTSSRLPSCCMFSVGSKKKDDSSHLDTKPFLRVLPPWLYLSQVSPQGPISKRHPTGGLGFSSQQILVPADIEQDGSPCAKASVSIYPRSCLARGAWEHGKDFKFSSGLTRNVKN